MYFFTRTAQRLEAMLLEAKGSWELAEKAYMRLLEDSPLDQIIHKRRVAMAKAQGNISRAIEFLNKYLEIFMADHDAWRELAEIYVSQQIRSCPFCDCRPSLWWSASTMSICAVPNLLFSIVLISTVRAPQQLPVFVVDLVLYTLGGLENLQIAKKYYSSTIDLTGGKNTRALFDVCLCISAIAQLVKGKVKEDKEGSQVQSLAAKVLEKDCKQRAPDKLPQLTTVLNSLTLSS
ncbi:unnamed protein product [Lupinus luteus]|uniref:ER membrane protein complex subunit 2 n=1 Tax=Lupinus luteus TaxID=3873 RepID=A0AAV1VZJ6_LUPLU